MGKGEIARYEQFLLFPQCFQKACYSGASKGVIVWEWVKGGGNMLKNHRHADLNIRKSKAEITTLQQRYRTAMHFISFNPFPNKPWFLRVCSRSLLKTLWEKEKLLEASNFYFSHSVFYPFKELSAISSNLKLSSASSLSLESSKFGRLGKG